MLTSKKLTEYLDFSCENFKLGWKLLGGFEILKFIFTFCPDEKYNIYIP